MAVKFHGSAMRRALARIDQYGGNVAQARGDIALHLRSLGHYTDVASERELDVLRWVHHSEPERAAKRLAGLRQAVAALDAPAPPLSN